MQSSKENTPQVVSFTQMKDGTREDYALLDALEEVYVAQLPQRVLAAVKRLDQSYGGFQVSRYEHSLQTATRALRDGADEELVIAALIHDVGDDLAPLNHARIGAEMLRPYVRREVTWIVEQHGLFQSYYFAHHSGGDRHLRERLRGHPWFDACAAFCENWDQASFDPRYRSEALDTFEPLVKRIFSRPAHDPRYVVG